VVNNGGGPGTVRSTWRDRDPAVDGINFTLYLCLVIFFGSFGDAVACVDDGDLIVTEIVILVFVVVCGQQD
jgi:hypothetical protein